ncbi:MAG: flavin reductase family protein [Phycisphaerae bacterium]|jgi:flavin reductase (DIM6/NTAB) family NADH-FMN oxidoreductase RutF
MKAHRDFTTLTSAEREHRSNYKTLVSCVVPRPIALVSTVSADGVANLAPFSFFNGVCAKPPAVMFAPAVKRDGALKDTLANLREVDEFVVNLVSHEIGEAMNQASYPYPPEVSEFEAVGLTLLPSRLVRPSRVAQSPIHMECKLIQTVPVGAGPMSTSICIGEVLCFHIAEGFVLDDGTADIERLDLIGRMGAEAYCTTRDIFRLPRPTASP